MSNNLTNAQGLVISGNSGTGLATAVAAGDAGASVTIASRSKVKLDTALGSIQRTIALSYSTLAINRRSSASSWRKGRFEQQGPALLRVNSH